MTALERAHDQLGQTVLSWGDPLPGRKGEAPEEPRILLRVEEAAHRLGIERTLMYSLIQSGDVESVRLGRLRRVPVECLDEFVAHLRSAAREARS
jgi:excisionase family DNA binding protein